MKKEVDKEEMKRCLIDANIYEENLTDDLISEYYKAIKNSETSIQEESHHNREVILDESEKSLNESANELLEAINNSESIAPSKRQSYDISDDVDSSLDAFSQDILVKTKSTVAQDEPNNNNSSSSGSVHIDGKHEKEDTETILDIKKTPIGFNDMPKSQKIDKNMLKIISHELKFINIQNSRKYLTANSETRIKLLFNYHIAAAKLQAHYASLSTNMAPIGKPITAIDHDLCVNPMISSLKDEEMQLATESTYISRSGRMTKRKIYNEVDDSSLESRITPKRTRNDDEWLSKTTLKGKAAKSNVKKSESSEVIVNNNNNNNNNGILDKTLNKPHTKVRSDSPDSSQDVSLSGFLDHCEEAKESTPVIPKPRTYQRKGLSNDDIMSRSALFKDTGAPKKGRTGALLSAAREETEKKKLQEEEMAKFTDSLVLDSQIVDDESEKIVIDDDEPERKRVIPPLPSSRKPIHGRKRGSATGVEPLNISTKKPSLNSSNSNSNNNNNSGSMEEPRGRAVNGVGRRTPLARRTTNNNNNNNNNNLDRGEPSSSSSSPARAKKDVLMTPCPLCSVSFPQKEIEEHAATCGEDLFPQTSQPKRITCEVCDAVVPFTTEYEVHVKACIAKRNQGV